MRLGKEATEGSRMPQIWLAILGLQIRPKHQEHTPEPNIQIESIVHSATYGRVILTFSTSTAKRYVSSE